MSKSFHELLELAKSKGPKIIAVACAEDRDVLSAVKNAVEQKIVEPILVGDEEKIIKIAEEIGFNLRDFEVLHEADKVQASRIATSLVSSGKAHVLMKGLVDTSIIMKQVLDKEIGPELKVFPRGGI